MDHTHCPACHAQHNHPLTTQTTHLNVVLDRSGSMSAVRDQTIAGFNEWLATQQIQTADRALLSLTLFNDVPEVRYNTMQLGLVPLLTRDTYVPTGNTALNDAIMHTIRAMESRVMQGDRVLTVIFTDGYENASKEFKNIETVKAAIRGKESLGNWTFAFLMAGLEAQAQAMGQGYGLSPQNVRGYNAQNIGNTIGAVAHATTSYRSMANAATQDFLKDVQKNTDSTTK